MRTSVRLLTVVVAVLALAPAALAGTVSGLAVTGGAVHNVTETSITVTGNADFTGDVIAQWQAFSDPLADGLLLDDAQPPFVDLTAGFIEETPTGLNFTWQVADIPDVPGYTPAITFYYWEFEISGIRFSVRANIDALGNGIGRLNTEPCMTTGNIIQCTNDPNAVVTVTKNAVANTVTANVRRVDLDNPATGLSVAVAGARLSEVVLFQGIGAFFGVGLIPAATGDLADMDRPYVFGAHAEVALAPSGLTDADLLDPLNGFFPGTSSVPDGVGNFSATIALGGFPPGDYEAVAMACTGGTCGAIARTPVQLVV